MCIPIGDTLTLCMNPMAHPTIAGEAGCEVRHSTIAVEDEGGEGDASGT